MHHKFYCEVRAERICLGHGLRYEKNKGVKDDSRVFDLSSVWLELLLTERESLKEDTGDGN